MLLCMIKIVYFLLQNISHTIVTYTCIWIHTVQHNIMYVMGTTTVLINILTRNIVKPTRSLYDVRFKSYGSNSGFRVFGDLDLDL